MCACHIQVEITTLMARLLAACLTFGRWERHYPVVPLGRLVIRSGSTSISRFPMVCQSGLFRKNLNQVAYGIPKHHLHPFRHSHCSLSTPFVRGNVHSQIKMLPWCTIGSIRFFDGSMCPRAAQKFHCAKTLQNMRQTVRKMVLRNPWVALSMMTSERLLINI